MTDCTNLNCETSRNELAALKRHHETVLRLVSPLIQPIDEHVDAIRFMMASNEVKLPPKPMSVASVTDSLTGREIPPFNSLGKDFIEKSEIRVKGMKKDAQKAVKSVVESEVQRGKEVAKKLADNSVSQVRGIMSQVLNKLSLPFMLTGITGAAISGPLTFISPYAAYLGPLTAGAGIIGFVTMFKSNGEKVISENVKEAKKTLSMTTDKLVPSEAKAQIRDFLGAGGWIEKTASGERWKKCGECGKHHGPFRGHDTGFD